MSKQQTGRHEVDADTASVWQLEAPPPQGEPTLLEGDCEADVAIIGAGFTGVSTAMHLSERFPEQRVVLLEAQCVGNGASGRNGGIVLNLMPYVEADVAQTRRHYEATSAAIARIGERARAYAPGAFRGGCTLRVATSEAEAHEQRTKIEPLMAAGMPLRLLDAKQLAQMCNVTGATQAICDPNAGVLNGLAFLRGMSAELERRGVQVFERSPVRAVRQGEQQHEVCCERGVVRARTLVLATNGYSPSLGFFRRNMIPLSSRVIATRPLSDAEISAIGWSDEITGYSDDHPRVSYASVTPGRRVLFGGGASAAYRYTFGGGTRDDDAHIDRGYGAIEARMLSSFPALRGVEIDARWSGPLGLTFSRACSIGRLRGARDVLYAVGFSGNGVTLANLAGEILCDIYAGEEARWSDVLWLQRRLEWVPPEPLRWLGYQLYTRVLGFTPRVKPRRR